MERPGSASSYNAPEMPAGADDGRTLSPVIRVRAGEEVIGLDLCPCGVRRLPDGSVTALDEVVRKLCTGTYILVRRADGSVIKMPAVAVTRTPDRKLSDGLLTYIPVSDLEETKGPCMADSGSYKTPTQRSSSLIHRTASVPELDNFPLGVVEKKRPWSTLRKLSDGLLNRRRGSMDLALKASPTISSTKRRLSDSLLFRRFSGSSQRRHSASAERGYDVVCGYDHMSPGRTEQSDASLDSASNLWPLFDSVEQDGEPKDYQLWVVSGKEDSPYPLIGEYPVCALFTLRC